MTIEKICVYCGSADNLNPDYLASARRMGELIAQRNLHLVFEAGATGLMGAVADGALETGGEVTGIIPEYFSPCLSTLISRMSCYQPWKSSNRRRDWTVGCSSQIKITLHLNCEHAIIFLRNKFLP